MLIYGHATSALTIRTTPVWIVAAAPFLLFASMAQADVVEEIEQELDE